MLLKKLLTFHCILRDNLPLIALTGRLHYLLNSVDKKTPVMRKVKIVITKLTSTYKQVFPP